MKRQIVHPEVGEITLSSTRLNRRISLVVRPTGEIRLSFPTYISEERAMAFLEQKMDWVIRAKERLAKRAKHVVTPQERERMRNEAKKYLPRRVAHIAQVCNLSYNKLTIRSTRTKWGSCSWQNNISLSLYLMALPSHLIDYVIIHELCHTRHHNHSAEFHAMVNSLVGGREKELARELRSFCICS